MVASPNEVFGGSIDNDAFQGKLKVIALRPANGGLVVDTQVSLGAGGQVAEGAVGGAELPAFSCTTNDEIYWSVFYAELWDCDFRRDFQCAVVYNTAEATAETDIGIKVEVKGVANAVATSDAGSSPDGSAAWTDLVSGGAGLIYESTFKPMNCQGAFDTRVVAGSRVATAPDTVLMFKATITNKGANASADDLRIHGVLLRYTLEMCHHTGQRQGT